MKAVSFLLGLTGFVAVCVLSFNYVEGHEFTKLKEQLKEYSVALERVSHDAKISDQDKLSVEGRLRQACSLLAAADIANDVCEEPEDETAEEVVESGEQSSDEESEDSDARN